MRDTVVRAPVMHFDDVVPTADLLRGMRDEEFLTAGVDIATDRIEIAIIGWPGPGRGWMSLMEAHLFAGSLILTSIDRRPLGRRAARRARGRARAARRAIV